MYNISLEITNFVIFSLEKKKKKNLGKVHIFIGDILLYTPKLIQHIEGRLIRFGLFAVLSTFKGYLMPKPSLQ